MKTLEDVIEENLQGTVKSIAEEIRKWMKERIKTCVFMYEALEELGIEEYRRMHGNRT